MRTSTNGWDSETKASSCVIPISKPNWGSDYFVSTDAANATTIRLVTANADANLDEKVEFGYSKLPSVSGRGLDRLYKPTTPNGYRFSITNSFIRETADSTNNSVNDDAIQVKIEFSAPSGANVISGNQVAEMLLHTLGFVLETNDAGTALKSTQPALDRLLSGATKPYQLV